MKYFGTDGFRGRVSDQLNAKQAFEIGRYLGYYFYHQKQSKPRLIIGKDTRLSGDVLEHALASGAASWGCDVYLLGVCPTPSLSYLIRQEGYDFGVMISASHNPYMDNGIKIFNDKGFKLDEEIELQIEEHLDDPVDKIGWGKGDNLGQIINFHDTGIHQYANWLSSLIPIKFKGLKILVDLANGSATSIAKEVLEQYEAEVTVISDQPDGYNINTDCGSTHLNVLQQKMRQGNYDVGLAFDGDADRMLAVDELGNIVDGDGIMYLFAKHLAANNKLKDNNLVTTVMSNLGLYKSLERLGITTSKVQVGDKYVTSHLFEHGYSLGGEQSGHIIFSEETVTGDGLLSAIHLLEIVTLHQKPLSELVKEMDCYPQVLKNVKVNDKHGILNNPLLQAKIKEIEKKLGDDGRILVRASGTEQLIRVMVEAETIELCDNCVREMIEIIEKKGK